MSKSIVVKLLNCFVPFIISFLLISCKKTDIQKSAEKSITSFAFLKQYNTGLSSDIIGNIEGDKISFLLPSGTGTYLVASFTNSSKSHVYIDNTEQISGITQNDFANNLIYKVVAEDGSENDYSVSVHFLKSNQKDLITFEFLKSYNPTLTSDIIGTITNGTVTLNAPPGTSKILLPTFTTSQFSKVYIDTVEQKSGINANDFSNVVTYKIMAEDSSVNTFKVIVNFQKSSAKELTSFNFLKANNSNLPSDIIGSIVNGKVSVIIPPGTSAKLIPSFTISDKAKAVIDNTAQISGVTQSDFSNPIDFKVVAEDSSSAVYTVTVMMDAFPELDKVVKNVMATYNIPGLSIAIVKNEKLVYVQSYGYADAESDQAVTNNSLFRIASDSKPITAIAILKLVEERRLSLNQTVFGSNGVLGNDYGVPPAGSNKDKITIKNLLEHTSGWTNEPNDPMFANLDWSFKPLIQDMVLNRPLKFNPGDSSYYLNFGYCILGRVIEKVTSSTYEDYVKNEILSPCGITDMKVGGNTLADRLPNEVKYYDVSFSPYSMNVHRMDSPGGWIASATDLMRFMVRIDRENYKKDLLSSASLNNLYFGYYNWIFYGGIPGTNSDITRLDDTFSFSFVLNRNISNGMDDVYNQVKQVILARVNWPVYDLF